MYEQLDNDLKKRIGEVFENIETPTADEGWLLLREKFPAKEKKILPIFWFRLGAAAAIFIILLGVSFLIFKDQNRQTDLATQLTPNKLNNKLNKREQAISGIHPNAISKVQAIKQFKKDSIIKEDINKDSHVISNQDFDSYNRIAINKRNLLKVRRQPGRKKVASNMASRYYLSSTKIRKSNNIESNNYQANIEKDNTNAASIELDRIVVEELNARKLNLVIKNSPKTFDIKIQKPETENNKSAIYSFLAKSSENYRDSKEDKDDEPVKKLSFSLYEATYLNFAKGSNTEVNLGIGLTADVYLIKNLKLITGINIGKNSLDYTSASILNNNQNIFAYNQVHNTSAFAVNGFTPATQIKDYNVGLIGLDIPINIKYELENYYLVAGVSSGTFINETYAYQYTYQNSSVPLNQQTQGSSSSKSFNSFYFAKTINIAFGADLPFGKNNIIFEPFIKYPIGGIGSQDLRFGASGLNLKFKF